MLFVISIGEMCLEKDFSKDTLRCLNNKENFLSMGIKDVTKAICIGEECHEDEYLPNLSSYITLKKGISTGEYYKGTYKSAEYIFESHEGFVHEKLTQELCDKYKLTCGSW